jgi:hypothetical protein
MGAREKGSRRVEEIHDSTEMDWKPRLVFGGFWILLFISAFLVAAPWGAVHGFFLAGVGILMMRSRPTASLPGLWWLLAAVFVVAGLGAFLPAACFPTPEWRTKLEALGVHTGSMVAIQAQQAGETFTIFVVTLVIGLWVISHRPTAGQARVWALAFTVGVAVYAMVSKMALNRPDSDHVFGFFPNRNHTATYLAMGSLCGLGSSFQALRDKRFGIMAVALIATAICLLAVAGWSISRGGVVLVGIGCLLWLPMLGIRYLGINGLRVLGLVVLAGGGMFIISETTIKDRISKSVEQAGNLVGTDPGPTLNDINADAAASNATISDAPVSDVAVSNVEFRIPIYQDTLQLIKNFKWTGVGAGQFAYIFPQYRDRTTVLNDIDCAHPESDWLWMASETGVIATLAILALLILACRKSLVPILTGRDRAIRSGCLVAAMLVPIHGIFDVPGHRITLALSAAFLFTLSLRDSSKASSPPASTPSKWPFRIAGAAILFLALWVIRAQWGGGPQPAIMAGKIALDRSQALLKEDDLLRTSAAQRGEEFQPWPGDDRLEKGLAMLESAKAVAPLDRDILHLESFLALHFDDKKDLVDRNFALNRLLDPTCVKESFNEGRAWALIDPQRTELLWEDALERAKALDNAHPATKWSVDNTLDRIRQASEGIPALEEKFVH